MQGDLPERSGAAQVVDNSILLVSRRPDAASTGRMLPTAWDVLRSSGWIPFFLAEEFVNRKQIERCELRTLANRR